MDAPQAIKLFNENNYHTFVVTNQSGIGRGIYSEKDVEKLIEVLQNEANLNVFLISHDFTHPLIDKVSIVKDDNISSIQ